jgi:WD40 repeat protein
MSIHHISLFSILFLITACNSTISPVLVEPTKGMSFTAVPTITSSTEPTLETGTENVLLDFALSPDGKNLAVYLNTGIYLYDVQTSEQIIFSEFETGEYYSQLNSNAWYYPPLGAPGAIAFSPNGQEIAFSSKFQDELIRIWNWKSKTSNKIISNYPNGNFVRELEYSPDGNVLLIRSTYPSAKLRCEIGSEDSLTLVSLASSRDSATSKVFEMQGCNQYSSIEYYFSQADTLYLFHFGAAYFYQMYEINAQTGDALKSDEIDSRTNGRVYSVSSSGDIFAARENSTDGVFRTVLIDPTTKNKMLSLSGQVVLLNDKNRFLVSTLDSQWQLQENNNVLCTFDELEYLSSRISRNKSVLAVLTREKSIQIWDVSSCRLINTIPFG